ncbi:cytochrome P450 [Streptomyces sp. NPDC048106]|uniref:cytochrome P450 n=1 Tax=Streptomyces sp. NPDC048106 TaxID=3155750 RepID=UPI00345612F9
MSERSAELPEWPMPRSCPFSPPDQYAALRERPPVKVRIRGGEAWLVTRHDHARLVLNDPRFTADDQHPGFPVRVRLPPAPRMMSFNRMDDPDHERLRRMGTTEFTARRTRRLRPWVEEIVGRLLDELEKGPNPADLVTGFSLRLPSLVIGRLLGVAEGDEAVLARQTETVLSQEAEPERIQDAYLGMTQYLDRLATDRERSPRDDLVSRLATRYVATGELSHEDLVAMARMFLVAGHETTAHQITLSVLSLLRAPEQLAELRRDPGLYPAAVEELLRYWSIPQDNQARAAAVDVHLDGADIRKGDGVIVAIPGANHDESVFPGAANLDVRRDAHGHVAFGHGKHLCLGAPLARMELEIALRSLFSRFPALRLAVEPQRVAFRENSIVYGIKELPVAW